MTESDQLGYSAAMKTRLAGNHTFKVPAVHFESGAQIGELDINDPFLSCVANTTVTMGENSRVDHLTILSELPSGGRGGRVHVEVAASVFLERLTLVDSPGDVTGGLGGCVVEVRRQPRFGSAVRVVLGADWAYQNELHVLVDGDTVMVNAAVVFPVIKRFDRVSGELVIMVGFEPTGTAPRNPKA